MYARDVRWRKESSALRDWGNIWIATTGLENHIGDFQCQFWHWSTRTNSAVWPLPYACAQPYHPGSGSHVQLLRPYWGSSAWHSLRVCERANPCIKDPLLPRRVQKSTPLRGVRTGEPVYQRPITAQASTKKYSFKRSTNGRTRVSKTHYCPGECKKVLLQATTPLWKSGS